MSSGALLSESGHVGYDRTTQVRRAKTGDSLAGGDWFDMSVKLQQRLAAVEAGPLRLWSRASVAKARR